jgi:hypothetical protein
VCYQLVLVSPLTVSEVRSMLPPGVRADILDGPALARWRGLLRGAQAAVHLRVGRCACRLVPARFAGAHTDEAHLRAEHRRRGTPRDRVLPALERHRLGADEGAVVPPLALPAFVAEHARNAGPALFALAFGDGPALPAAAGAVRDVPLAETRAGDAWLREDAAVRVTR